MKHYRSSHYMVVDAVSYLLAVKKPPRSGFVQRLMHAEVAGERNERKQFGWSRAEPACICFMMCLVGGLQFYLHGPYTCMFFLFNLKTYPFSSAEGYDGRKRFILYLILNSLAFCESDNISYCSTFISSGNLSLNTGNTY